MDLYPNQPSTMHDILERESFVIDQFITGLRLPLMEDSPSNIMIDKTTENQ